MRTCILFALLALSNASFALTEIDSCGYLSTPGETYILNSSLSGEFPDINSGYDVCLVINASSVVLDCDDLTLSSSLALSNIGILVYDADSVVVKNCSLTGYSEGIHLYSSEYGRYENNYIYNITPIGIGIYADNNSHSNVLFNNIVNRTLGGYDIRSNNNTLVQNVVFNYSGGTTSIGFGITGNDNNLTSNAAVYSERALSRGFSVSGFRNNFTSNIAATIFNDRTYGFYVMGNNSRFVGNMIENNTNGIYLSGANETFISNNNINNSYYYGIRSSSSFNNTFINNDIFSNGTPTSGIGILIEDARNHSIMHNNITTNGVGLANYGVELVRSANNTLSNNNISTNGIGRNNYGIYLHSPTTPGNTVSNTIEGNVITTNGQNATDGLNYGIFLYADTANSKINNNTLRSNSIRTNGTARYNSGIYLRALGTGSQIQDNLVQDNNISTNGSEGNYGIHLYAQGASSVLERNNLTGNNITTNGRSGGTNFGIYVYAISTSSANGNNMRNNSIRTNGGGASNHGIYLYSSDSASIRMNNVSANNITTGGTSNNYGLYLSYSPDNDISMNNLTTSGSAGSNYGMYVVYSNNSQIHGNEIRAVGSTNLNIGIRVLYSNNSNINDNNISTSGTSSNEGIRLETCRNNSVARNSIATDGSRQGNYGIYLLGANESDVAGNNATTTSSTYHNFGFILHTSHDNRIQDNLANGTTTGFFIWTNSNNTSLSGNTAHGTGGNGSGTYDGYGLLVWDANQTRVEGMHLYDNPVDFKVNGTGIFLNLSGMVFDGDAGFILGFTNLSLVDTVSSSYAIDHASTPPSPPGTTFAQKSLNITNLTEGVSIDTLIWHWADSELGYLDESKLALLRYSAGAWQQPPLNDTPDISENRISLSGHSPSSIYTLMEYTDEVAGISVQKTVNATSAAVGDVVQYTANISNNGTANLTVSAIDILPDGVEFIGSNFPPDSTSGGIIQWDSIFVNLTPGSWVLLIYNVSVTSGGVQENDIQIFGDPDLGLSVSANGSVSFTASEISSPPEYDDDGPNRKPLQILADTPDCEYSLLAIESDGERVPSASVRILNLLTGELLFDGFSDSEGIVRVEFHSTRVRVIARKPGYETARAEFEAGWIACSSSCENDEMCRSTHGHCFGPGQTYPIPPISTHTGDIRDDLFSNCVWDEINEDEAWEGQVDPSHLVLCKIDFLERTDKYFDVSIVASFDPGVIDDNYLRICSDECTRKPDCWDGDFCELTENAKKAIILGGGDCKRSRYIEPGAEGSSCTMDSDCNEGNYCEPVYSVCLQGCNEGHEANCGAGFFCNLSATDAPPGATGPANVNICMPGCRGDENCEWYQFCNSTFSCQNLSCGKINNHQISQEWDCEPVIAGEGYKYNPFCPIGCPAGKFCNASNKCQDGCQENPDCPSGMKCENNTCKPIETRPCMPECPASQICSAVFGVPKCVNCTLEVAVVSIISGLNNTVLFTGSCDSKPCANCDIYISNDTGNGNWEHVATGKLDAEGRYSKELSTGNYTANLSYANTLLASKEFKFTEATDPPPGSCVASIVLGVVAIALLEAFVRKKRRRPEAPGA